MNTFSFKLFLIAAILKLLLLILCVLSAVFASQGTVVVAGRARSVVIGVGSSTAMGSIRDAMLRTEDVSSQRFASHMRTL
jgi:magnesium-transporting ATPase (P-type)